MKTIKEPIVELQQSAYYKAINNPLGIGEPRNSFKYKFADEDAKKSRINADKLAALKASLERNKSC